MAVRALLIVFLILLSGLLLFAGTVAVFVIFLSMKRKGENRPEQTELLAEVARLREEVEHLRKSSPSRTSGREGSSSISERPLT